MSAAAEVSVYDRMCWPEGQLERALALGAHRRELLAYLGRSEYALLRSLARAAECALSARTRAPRGGSRTVASRSGGRTRVYLLPGMLGTQLGWLRAAGQPPDLLWLDPSDVIDGRLTALRAGLGAQRRASGARLVPLGAIPYSYLALKLRLTAAGFDVVLYGYDWRRDLSALARALARRLEADSAERLLLVGHSMGGLLARAALGECTAETRERRVARLIGLGTPHGGAISAAQVLRATYPVLLRLTAMDRWHGPEALSATFRSFLSLYQMLPSSESSQLDLFDLAAWPARGTRPDPKLLQAARHFRATLAPADARFVSIVGTGQRTVTGIERRGGQFRYEVSAAGDGTVAAACATLPGARDYSLRCEHSELPRSAVVAAALIELLRHGRTRRLREGVRPRKGECVYVTDDMLRRAFEHKLDWHRLSAASRRRYLNEVNAPPAAYRPSR